VTCDCQRKRGETTQQQFAALSAEPALEPASTRTPYHSRQGRAPSQQPTAHPDAPLTRPVPQVQVFEVASRTRAGLHLGNGWLLSRRYQLHSASEAEVALTYSLVRSAATLHPRALPASSGDSTDTSHSDQLCALQCAPRPLATLRSFTAYRPRSPQSKPRLHRSPMNRALRICHPEITRLL
jgi:hypothetical protein